jgi:hypothetical protein
MNNKPQLRVTKAEKQGMRRFLHLYQGEVAALDQLKPQVTDLRHYSNRGFLLIQHEAKSAFT